MLTIAGFLLIGAAGLLSTLVLTVAWILDWTRAELARTRSCS